MMPDHRLYVAAPSRLRAQHALQQAGFTHRDITQGHVVILVTLSDSFGRLGDNYSPVMVYVVGSFRQLDPDLAAALSNKHRLHRCQLTFDDLPTKCDLEAVHRFTGYKPPEPELLSDEDVTLFKRLLSTVKRRLTGKPYG